LDLRARIVSSSRDLARELPLSPPRRCPAAGLAARPRQVQVVEFFIGGSTRWSGRALVGNTVSSAMIWSARGRVRVGLAVRTRASLFRVGRELFSGPPWRTVKLAGCLVLVLDQKLEPRARASYRPAPVRRVFELAAGCGRLAEQCELDCRAGCRLGRPRSGANDREARASSRLSSWCLPKSLSWMRRILIGRPFTASPGGLREGGPKAQHLTEVGQLSAGSADEPA